MQYRIKNSNGAWSRGGQILGPALWSTGYAGGKTWGSLSSFASHLASRTSAHEKLHRAPYSLIKIYGNCTVQELDPVMGFVIKETPFGEWYSKYVNTSEKFAPTRRAERDAAKKQSLSQTLLHPTPAQAHTMSDAARLVAEPVTMKKPAVATAACVKPVIGWDVQTKTTVERALKIAEKFVPNMKFERMKEHPKNGETYAHIVISGENYALLKL